MQIGRTNRFRFVRPDFLVALTRINFRGDLFKYYSNNILYNKLPTIARRLNKIECKLEEKAAIAAW